MKKASPSSACPATGSSLVSSLNFVLDLSLTSILGPSTGDGGIGGRGFWASSIDLVRDFSGLGWVGGLGASNINRCSTSSLGIFGTTVVTCVYRQNNFSVDLVRDHGLRLGRWFGCF